MKYALPIIAINYKAYSQAFGSKALEIAKAAEKVHRETGATIIIAPPFTELFRLKQAVEIPVFAQHADPIDPGAHTGYIPLEAIKEVGVDGVILNHSEHKLITTHLYKLIKKAKQLGLITLVCADEPEIGASIAVFNPDMIAVEPPELIGTGIPVSKAKPEVVTNSVSLIRKINDKVTILTGAGITTGDDVAAAIKLGTAGVLVASAVMKAKDPYKVILDMATKGLETLNR